MMDNKATGNDELPGDVLLILGEDVLGIVTQLISKNTKLGSGQRISPKLKTLLIRRSQSTKCSDHCTISLIAHTGKIVARIYI